MGVDAVRAQSLATVLIIGMGPLGAEIAKNIVLSGCKRLIVCDSTQVTQADFAGQFLLRPSDIVHARTRAKASVPRLRLLNYYIKVDVCSTALDVDEIEGSTWTECLRTALAGVSLVIMCGMPPARQVAINNYCRMKNIWFISAEVQGLFAQLFVDGGPEYTVLDTDGEEAKELLLKNITCANPGVCTSVARHDLNDGK